MLVREDSLPKLLQIECNHGITHRLVHLAQSIQPLGLLSTHQESKKVQRKATNVMSSYLHVAGIQAVMKA
jgi:hypothetical protein